MFLAHAGPVSLRRFHPLLHLLADELRSAEEKIESFVLPRMSNTRNILGRRLMLRGHQVRDSVVCMP